MTPETPAPTSPASENLTAKAIALALLALLGGGGAGVTFFGGPSTAELTTQVERVRALETVVRGLEVRQSELGRLADGIDRKLELLLDRRSHQP